MNSEFHPLMPPFKIVIVGLTVHGARLFRGILKNNLVNVSYLSIEEEFVETF